MAHLPPRRPALAPRRPTRAHHPRRPVRPPLLQLGNPEHDRTDCAAIPPTDPHAVWLMEVHPRRASARHPALKGGGTPPAVRDAGLRPYQWLLPAAPGPA